MTPDSLFQICNTIVLPAWLLLIFAPKWKWTGRIVLTGIVLILCIVYVMGAIETISNGKLDFDSFGSLEGVMSLFTEPEAVLIGWVHYLAFDLVVGWLIVQNAIKHEVEAGSYGSTSEVIRDAMRLWQRQQLLRRRPLSEHGFARSGSWTCRGCRG